MMSKIFHSLIFRFIIVTLVFFAATSPIIVLFGPFGNLKRAVVGAYHAFAAIPQYITWLYNQEELNEILGVVKTTEQTQVLSFKPRSRCHLYPLRIGDFQKITHETGRFNLLQRQRGIGTRFKGKNLRLFRRFLQRRIMRLPQLTAGDFMIPMVREPAVCPMGLSFKTGRFNLLQRQRGIGTRFKGKNLRLFRRFDYTQYFI